MHKYFVNCLSSIEPQILPGYEFHGIQAEWFKPIKIKGGCCQGLNTKNILKLFYEQDFCSLNSSLKKNLLATFRVRCSRTSCSEHVYSQRQSCSWSCLNGYYSPIESCLWLTSTVAFLVAEGIKLILFINHHDKLLSYLFTYMRRGLPIHLINGPSTSSNFLYDIIK